MTDAVAGALAKFRALSTCATARDFNAQHVSVQELLLAARHIFCQVKGARLLYLL